MIGGNIKKARTKKHMTQEQLADALNVTRQAVSNWENEKTQPDLETLNNLSLTLEVSIEELIYGEKYHGEEAKAFSTETVKNVGGNAVTMGTVLAMILSFTKWGSIFWALFHGLLGWAYVIYYFFRYY